MKFWEKQHRGLMLLSVLDTMRSNPLTCDFEVKFHGHTFPAHRIVLIASSGYFRRLLQGGSQEVEQGFVELEAVNGMDASSIKSCLEYMYTGKIDVNFDTVDALLKTCHYFQFDEVKELCFKYLKTSISPSKCLQILECAVTYRSESTMDATVRFIAKKYPEISTTIAYRQADLDIIIEIMRTSREHTAIYIWRGITNWIEYDLGARSFHLVRLLTEITEYDLKHALDVIVRHPLVLKDGGAMKYIVTSVIFVQWADFSRYINDANCYQAYEWTTLYNSDMNSELFRGVVLDYLKANFIDKCENDKFVTLTVIDLYTLLDSVETRCICQTIRWQSIVRWIEGTPSNETHFEKLFALLDLKSISPEFIQRTIRSYDLVQKSHKCKDAILNAMFFHSRKESRINSCLLFDKVRGELHRHYDDSWKNIMSDSRLIGGSLLGLRGEVFVFNSPHLYKISRDGRIEVKRPCPESEVVRIAVVHAGKIFIFYHELWLWVYEISNGEWRFCLYGFDIPDDTSACSTEEGIIFLGGGFDGKFRRLYNRESVAGETKYIPPMKYKRRNATCVSVENMVYLVGGTVFPNILMNQVEIYCVKTNSWSSFAPRLPSVRLINKLVCCCEADNRIYVASSSTESIAPLRASSVKSRLLIDVVPNWNSSVISNAPDVDHPEMAGWICYEPKTAKDQVVDEKRRILTASSDKPFDGILARQQVAETSRRVIKTAWWKLRR